MGKSLREDLHAACFREEGRWKASRYLTCEAYYLGNSIYRISNLVYTSTKPRVLFPWPKLGKCYLYSRYQDALLLEPWD